MEGDKKNIILSAVYMYTLNYGAMDTWFSNAVYFIADWVVPVVFQQFRKIIKYLL